MQKMYSIFFFSSSFAIGELAVCMARFSCWNKTESKLGRSSVGDDQCLKFWEDKSHREKASCLNNLCSGCIITY